MPSKHPVSDKEPPEKERVSNKCQTTIYCNPVLWKNALLFIDAVNEAKKGKPGPRPPQSASALVVELLTKHLAANGPKVGVRLPDDLLQKR